MPPKNLTQKLDVTRSFCIFCKEQIQSGSAHVQCYQDYRRFQYNHRYQLQLTTVLGRIRLSTLIIAQKENIPLCFDDFLFLSYCRSMKILDTHSGIDLDFFRTQYPNEENTGLATFRYFLNILYVNFSTVDSDLLSLSIENEGNNDY